ncbi:MAG TPA: hypothetical protein VGY98_05430 [Verrucomicrobiae bacterium]|nr:hypothetical protein [Verrucomicrobiae bacterium]
MKLNKSTYYPNITKEVLAGAFILMVAGASAQNLFVSNFTTGDIYEITPGGVQSVFASGMNYPFGIAFNNAGDLYVANTALDGGNGYISEITPNGTQSTFASGIDPKALAVNGAGDVFEADYNSGNIYEYTPSGTQSTFATGLSTPQVLAFNSAGNLFVGGGYGNGNGTIIEITPSGNQSLFASGLSFPGGMAFNSAGDLFVGDETGGAIYEYTPQGVQSTFTTVNGDLNGLAFNNAGDLFAATSEGPIIEITPSGSQSTFATQSGNPNGLAFQPVPEPSVLGMFGACASAYLFYRRTGKSANAKA